MAHLEPGSIIAGRFAIVRFIAEGGMGEVYEAEDRELGERIALKFLSRRNTRDESMLQRFRREVLLARRVTHPNVCRIFDVFTDERTGPSGEPLRLLFVTMELLRGETVEKHLRDHGPIKESDALPLVVQMCRALEAAHGAGVVHRDLKCGNVMLVPQEDGALRVVVTDFGLATSTGPPTSFDPGTGVQKIYGTPAYMAPEQIAGEGVGPASDIYSLGVVLCEMITGHLPFKGKNPMDMLVRRLRDPPTSPRELLPSVSEVWNRVILHCLEENPKKRPPAPRFVVKALAPQAWSDAATLSLPRLRNRWPWAVAGAALLAASILLLVDNDPSEKRQGLPFSPTRLSTAAGLEIEPSFSPDGKKLVYSGELDDGRFEIFLQELDSSDRRQLTEDGQAFEPAFSPDGTRIAYHSKSQGGIFLISATGGVAQRLTVSGSRPAFSPDGRKLAFQTESSPLVADSIAPALPPSTLRLVDFDHQGSSPLTQGGDPDGGHGAPTFSPDGRFIVFSSSRRGYSEIWALDLETKAKHPLIQNPPAYDPVVAGDGRHVYFSVTQKEVKNLWQIEVNPATLEPVGQPTEIAGLGVTSIRTGTLDKSGKKLAFAALLSRSNLVQVELDPSGKPKDRESALTEGDDRYSRPSFSPDQKLVVSDYWQVGVPIGLAITELATGIKRPLKIGGGQHSMADWRSDGRIVFHSERPEGVGLWQIDPANQQESLIAALDRETDWATLAPDNHSIAFVRSVGFPNIWLRPKAGGPDRQLTAHNSPAAYPIWSTDSRFLAYQVRVGEQTQVWEVEVASGNPRQLTFEDGKSWPYCYSPDNRRIAFAGERLGRWNIFWIDRQSLEIQTLTRARRLTGYRRYPTFSPDGRYLVFEKADAESDIFVVDPFG